MQLAQRVVGHLVNTPWLARPLETQHLVLPRPFGEQEAALDVKDLALSIETDFELPGSCASTRDIFLRLGIVLLELWMASSFEEGIQSQIQAGHSSEDLTTAAYFPRLMLALRWLEDATTQLLPHYCDAVTLCLRHETHPLLNGDRHDPRDLALFVPEICTRLQPLVGALG